MKNVNWFYCFNCQKDVESRFELDMNVSEHDRAVNIVIFMICCECGGTLSVKETPFMRLT